MSELVGCNESDQRRKIKVFFDNILIMMKNREDHHFFAVLYFLLEEIALLSISSKPRSA